MSEEISLRLTRLQRAWDAAALSLAEHYAGQHVLWSEAGVIAADVFLNPLFDRAVSLPFATDWFIFHVNSELRFAWDDDLGRVVALHILGDGSEVAPDWELESFLSYRAWQATKHHWRQLYAGRWIALARGELIGVADDLDQLEGHVRSSAPTCQELVLFPVDEEPIFDPINDCSVGRI